MYDSNKYAAFDKDDCWITYIMSNLLYYNHINVDLCPYGIFFQKWQVAIIRKNTITDSRPIEESQNTNRYKTSRKQLKYSNQLSLFHQDDCKTRKDAKHCTAKQGSKTAFNKLF